MITLQLVSPHLDSFPESTTGKPNRGRTTGLYGNQWHLGRENVCVGQLTRVIWFAMQQCALIRSLSELSSLLHLHKDSPNGINLCVIPQILSKFISEELSSFKKDKRIIKQPIWWC